MSKTQNDLTLYLFRHGQTDWAKSGQHTGRTDIPLNDVGRQQAASLKGAVSHLKFNAVLVSPLSRAKQTAEIAGLFNAETIFDDLAEFDYGKYEGLTSLQIREQVADWTIWTHACPEGETLAQVANRTDNVIARANEIGGTVALFAHGHLLRILTARWLGVKPSFGQYLLLDPSTISILSRDRGTPAIKLWNSPPY
jgi:broad specificity phosphatase PhoE